MVEKFDYDDYKIPYCPKDKLVHFDSRKCGDMGCETCKDHYRKGSEICDYCEGNHCKYYHSEYWGGVTEPPNGEELCMFYGVGNERDIMLEREREQTWKHTGIYIPVEVFY
jgi:hypothetical protein